MKLNRSAEVKIKNSLDKTRIEVKHNSIKIHLSTDINTSWRLLAQQNTIQLKATNQPFSSIVTLIITIV